MGTSYKQGRVWNGKRLSYPKGPLIGPRKAAEIIDGVNALLTCKVELTDGLIAKVVISENGTVIQIPKSYLSPGGSAATSLNLVTLIGLTSLDVFVCRYDGGPSNGSEDFDVAAPVELRDTIASETIPLVGGGTEQWDYSSYNSAYQSRTSTLHGTSTSYTEVITPRWITGQKIAIMRVVNSGVTVDSVELEWIALAGGRAWAEYHG